MWSSVLLYEAGVGACNAETIASLPRERIRESNVRKALKKVVDSQPEGHNPVGEMPCGSPLKVSSTVTLKSVNGLDDRAGALTFTGWCRAPRASMMTPESTRDWTLS